MKDRYLFTCYQIKSRDDNKDTWEVSFQDNCESFTTMRKAVEFCKDNYAKYFIAVEKCDKDLFKEIKALE